MHRLGQGLGSTLARLTAVFDQSERQERIVADKYACHRWCDSTERKLINDLSRKKV
jgi:hypothetical protein